MLNGQCTTAAADAERAERVGETCMLFVFAKHCDKALASVDCRRRATNFVTVPHLAHHGGFCTQSGSLDALVGPLSPEASEELQSVDGFPSFW